MVALLIFIDDYILSLVWWIFFLSILVTMLVQFSVLNPRQPFVHAVWDTLTRLTEPVYRVVRRYTPGRGIVGMIDFVPLIVLILIMFLRQVVIPAWLIPLFQ